MAIEKIASTGATRRILWLLGSGLLGLATPYASADVMVSSLGITPDPGSDSITATNWLGNKFTTSSSVSSFTLDSITIQMAAASNTAGNFHLAIYSDSLGVPGSQVGSLLTGTTNPATAAQFTWTASDITLSPATSYWMVQEVTTGAGSYSPRFETSTPVVVGTWTMTGNYIYSANGGASWINPAHDGPSLYSISATAVPEPAALALCVGVGGFLCAYGRRRRA